jgi:hypothetical protein
MFFMGRRFHEPSDSPRSRWISAAQRLRAVRTASRIFLDCWVASRLSDHPGVERVAADVSAADDALADPANHDWSLLYRGSILDD